MEGKMHKFADPAVEYAKVKHTAFRVPSPRHAAGTFSGLPLLQRQPHCACGGGCPSCQKETSVQPKLSVSEPGNRYEQEADRVADQVMRTPAPEQRPQLSTYGGESELNRQHEGNEAQQQLDPSEGRAHESVGEALRSPGEPLEAPTREFMEARFGRSFNNVRIHTDASAVESANAVGARAYTTGNDVVFGRDQYKPSSPSGRRLVAHELAHTIQQSSLASSGDLKINRTLLQRQGEEQTSPADSSEAPEQVAGPNANAEGDGAIPLQSNNDISGNSEPERCTFGNRSLPYPFSFSTGVTFWTDVFSLGNATSVNLSISANYDGSPSITSSGSYCAELHRCRGADFFPPWGGGSGQGRQCRTLGTAGTMTWTGLDKTYGHYLKIWKGSGDSYTMSGRGTAS
jgi:hypothetical protein